MTRFSVYIGVSADGYIARPDGGLDWLERVQRPGVDYGYQAFADTCDALVIGRKTYDTALGFGAWPYEGKRVVVLTHRPGPDRNGEQFRSGPVTDVAAEFARDGVKRAYVDGGDVIHQFLAARLVDDVTLSFIPVLLGAGVRLFAGGEPEQALVLAGSESFPSGLVQVRYRVQRQ